ncbi:hypothetical protein AALB39_18035 [Lachnospiraceae bacterium 54-53]
MKLTVEMDIDLEESGLFESNVKDRLSDFAIELLAVGAEELGIALTLKKVIYEA